MPPPSEESDPKLRRDEFIGQFAITLDVQCLRSWPRRRKDAPLFLPASLREWIGIAGGRMTIEEDDFAVLAQAVIEDLHRSTRPGQRPAADLFTGRLYDALDRAGVAVTLKSRRPVTRAREGQRRSKTEAASDDGAPNR